MIYRYGIVEPWCRVSRECQLDIRLVCNSICLGNQTVLKSASLTGHVPTGCKKAYTNSFDGDNIRNLVAKYSSQGAL